MQPKYNTDNSAIDSVANDTGSYAPAVTNLMPSNLYNYLGINGYNGNPTATLPLDGMQNHNYKSPISYADNVNNPQFDLSTFKLDGSDPTVNAFGPTAFDYNKYNEIQQQAQADRHTAMYGGFGLGTVKLGLDIYDAIGRNQLNNKNMQLVDQQIAQNKQVMADRTQRNTDIAKAFGSNGVMSKPTGL